MFNRNVLLKQLLQGVNVFNLLLAQQHAEEQRRYEHRLKELTMLADIEYRDQAIAEMLLDKLLIPDAAIRVRLQNTAKHVQFLAEELPYKASEHNLTEAHAQEVCTHLRYLTKLLSDIDSLYRLRVVYAAALFFVDVISEFRHHERQHSIQHSLRQNVLEPLNDCIANQQSFMRRPNIQLTFICQPNEPGFSTNMNAILDGTVKIVGIKHTEAPSS